MLLIVDNLAKWAVSHRAAAPGYAHRTCHAASLPAHTTHRTSGAPRNRPHRTRGARRNRGKRHPLETPLAGSLILAAPLILFRLIVTAWSAIAYAWTCTPQSTQYYCESWQTWQAHYHNTQPNSAWVWSPRDAANDYSD